MVPGHGRLPAEKIQHHYVKRIESFGLNFKRDVINSTNDGCATMKKLKDLFLKKYLHFIMQLCLVHGLQLGIVKIFYKAMKEIQNVLDNNQDHNEDDDDQDESDVSEDETDEEEGNKFVHLLPIIHLYGR